MNLNRFTRDLWDLDTFKFFRDFEHFTTAQAGMTSLAADVSATVAAGSTRSGVAVLGTGTTDNNEAALYTTNALFLPVANKAIYGRIYAQYAEANTNAANVFLGFASSFGADLLVDNGAGPRTTGTICGIYKVDGGTLWNCVTRNGTTVTTTASTLTAGSTAYIDVEVMLNDWDGVNMQATFKVDGQFLKDSNGLVIRHLLPIASATIANLGAYLKEGSTTAEALNVDWLYGAELR